jgi:hypothetical protein
LAERTCAKPVQVHFHRSSYLPHHLITLTSSQPHRHLIPTFRATLSKPKRAEGSRGIPILPVAPPLSISSTNRPGQRDATVRGLPPLHATGTFVICFAKIR